MIELFEQQLKYDNRHSSKGNQLKWEKDGTWYKADYSGYEGLSEYVVSKLLLYSTLELNEFVDYDIEEIKYRNKIFKGARSKDLREEEWQIITVERLFRNHFNRGLYEALWSMTQVDDRLEFLCEQTKRITGIDSFETYMAKLLTIDALFLNEDRHTHNIAVLMNNHNEYKLCPIFDNGACLLADTTIDYPMDGDIYQLIESAKAKTVSPSFDEQLMAAEKLYGNVIKFSFSHADVEKIVNQATAYSLDKRERVKNIVFDRMRKYSYLFDNT